MTTKHKNKSTKCTKQVKQKMADSLNKKVANKEFAEKLDFLKNQSNN